MGGLVYKVRPVSSAKTQSFPSVYEMWENLSSLKGSLHYMPSQFFAVEGFIKSRTLINAEVTCIRVIVGGRAQKHM